MKILIFGLPGSGKTTLAKSFSKLIGGVWLNADEIRKHYDDWDFSPEARIRQAYRMRYLADGVERAGRIAVADFVCPTEETRNIFAADYKVWMDTITEGRYDDTNQMFEPPIKDYFRISPYCRQDTFSVARFVGATVSSRQDTFSQVVENYIKHIHEKT